MSDFVESDLRKSDGWQSGWIHSQVTWFKPERDSGFRVDLTILDPANLSIETFDLVEDYPNKGFFHDGPCIAIELKFIRDNTGCVVRESCVEDYLHIVQELRAAKESLITEGRYENASVDNIAFVAVVLCKVDEMYEEALTHLTETIRNTECPENVVVFLMAPSHFQRLPRLAGHDN